MFFSNFFNFRLTGDYQRTDTKPDKTFSILPTVLQLAGDVTDKSVVDLGCGNGFFTIPLANLGARQVIGIDNSEAQVAIANKKAPENVIFRCADVFETALPNADVYTVPFVTNYLRSISDLDTFLSGIYQALNPGGHVVFVIDLPDLFNHIPYKRRRRLGAVKLWGHAPHQDGSMICNHLFDGRGKKICSLWAYYFSQPTIQTALQNAGFENIEWHRPLISQEGLDLYGDEFWENYPDYPELGYITARK